MRHRSLAALKRDQSACRACVEAGYPLESLPVIAPGAGQRAYLFGQAPGVVEGEERPSLAGPRGEDAAAVARPRRGGVLRHVLLRVGDPLLSRPGGVGPRRPDADARGAAPLRALARRRAAPAEARPRRHGRRARGAAHARRAQRRRERRRPLPARRRRRDPASPSVRRVELAQRARESRARR